MVKNVDNSYRITVYQLVNFSNMLLSTFKSSYYQMTPNKKIHSDNKINRHFRRGKNTRIL